MLLAAELRRLTAPRSPPLRSSVLELSLLTDTDPRGAESDDDTRGCSSGAASVTNGSSELDGILAGVTRNFGLCPDGEST